MDDDHAEPAAAGQLHHLELYTSAFDSAVEFWDWVLASLGYEQKNEWAGGRSWECGPTYLVLVQAERTDHPFDRHAPGLNHLAFHADSRAMVDALTAAIQDREDATLLYPDRHPYAGGYYALYCEGPDGVKIEVVGPDANRDGSAGPDTGNGTE
ncbi:glyoxalase [Natronolimnobius sp. AArcel1]|uniref:VOC family protein n=1 Tax=Natronolimnobius sp. AArcel1 TaxID=1679093 RepID=UPI0013EB3F9F|nr:VOC family protein [Natronolimnobius sp. AArcel1]NGM67640.1 glyoxalase [Natronolimnobius sp. AArcel1]